MFDRKGYCKKYYQEHKELCRDMNKEWFSNNPELNKTYKKKYREEHKEELRIKSKQYYQKNKDNILEKAKIYLQKHPGYKSQCSKQWAIDNKEHYAKLIKQWAKNNPEKRRASQTKRNRNLGFNPLNKYFEGSEAHHINKNDVIYIIKELHRSIKHCLETGRNMEKINKVAMANIR